ncbi:MAG: hypothetical protein NT091_03180, partial [Candidatus Falkowbacteria bacterium]|nr:hypothetical protein [Candidatus Falkowbacteria bacterium]
VKLIGVKPINKVESKNGNIISTKLKRYNLLYTVSIVLFAISILNITSKSSLKDFGFQDLGVISAVFAYIIKNLFGITNMSIWLMGVISLLLDAGLIWLVVIIYSERKIKKLKNPN